MKHFVRTRFKERRFIKTRSIKTQMMSLFIGLIIAMLFILMIMNIWFLESFYVKDKQKQFVVMYETLEEAIRKDNITEESVVDELFNLAAKNNMFFLVADVTQQKYYSNVPNTEELTQQLYGFILNKSTEHNTILKSTDSYEIIQTRMMAGNIENLQLRGRLGYSSYVIISSPLESIQESVALANRFMAYIGSVVIVIGVILVWIFSRWLTDPILELATLSVQMANLDFDARYTSSIDNEIGVLGRNYNIMSKKLEMAITDLKTANYHLQKDIEKKEKLEQMRIDFFGNVSHELKTPIALIQGYAEGLKEVANDPESREFYCDVIIDEAAKMNELVKNLLTLNQMELGDDHVEFIRFNLTEVIAGVLQSMDIVAQSKNVKVIFRQKEPVYVMADEFKAEQVIRNYVSNAFNHVDGEMVIDVRIVIENDKARVTVFNTGNPIPEEDISRIWDKFYKVDKAHTREYGGNGIGLSIVKAIMESFHQKYGVNNYDNGVGFWFELDVK